MQSRESSALLACHTLAVNLFCVLYCVLPHGLSSKREDARSILRAKRTTIFTELLSWSPEASRRTILSMGRFRTCRRGFQPDSRHKPVCLFYFRDLTKGPQVFYQCVLFQSNTFNYLCSDCILTYNIETSRYSL